MSDLILHGFSLRSLHWERVFALGVRESPVYRDRSIVRLR